ncbi:MAG: tetratricopeptide repeat protein, partial [Candidatus Heimdallarchaeota archaeon]|nr:tetratricopeptide repeat protein [Candidatus Heimdallarchaeota archaeon]MCK4955701.1 tetratricopeptide repeat protein [Candidatus Heimdallarchaeota archaeon]
MPSSIQEEIDRIQHNYYFKFDVLDSIDDIDAILKNKEITKEERLKATILKNEIINVLTTLGDEKGSLEIGMQLAQEVMKESKDLGDEILILDSQMNLCNNYFSNNKWQELEKPLKEFLSSFEELKPSTDFHYLKRKGFYFIFKGVLPFIKIYTGEGTTDEEIEKGFQVWIEGEKFSEKNNLPYFQTAFLLNIGSIQTNRGELDLALETRQKMVKISKDIGSKLGYAFYLHYLAWAYFNKNEYKKFYEISKERLIIAEELAVKGMIAGSYYNLGIYYLTTGEYDEALDQYKQSLEIYQNMQNENSIAFLQKDCGYVYYLKGELDRA